MSDSLKSQTIVVFTGTKSDNINTINVDSFISAAKKYNAEKKWSWKMYTLGVNNDGKIRKDAYEKVKKELLDAEDEKALELAEEMSKFVELSAEEVVRNSRPDPAQRAAKQAQYRKVLEEMGTFSKADMDVMVAAIR